MRINEKEAVLEKDFLSSEKMLNENQHLKELYENNNWKLLVLHIEGTIEIRNIMTTTDKFEM